MKQIIAAMLAVCASSFASGEANAAASVWEDITGGRVRLVVAEPLPGNTAVQAMLQVDLQPGWKTYWRDPGDAGVPLQFDVSTSANAALAGIDYPAPHRFDDGTSVWAGYKEPVAFGLRFQRTDAAKPVTVSGNVFLGVCEKICVPVQFEFNVEVKDSATPTMHAELVAMALKSLPDAATAEFGVSAIAADAMMLRVEASVPDGAAQAELFLAAPAGFQFAAPVLKTRQNGKAVFEARVLFSPETIVSGPQVVEYTLVTDKGAVSGDVAFSQR